MRSADVIAVYDTVGVGARVLITTQPFKRAE
jgi:lipoprotein-anchoring transpeptidase ErfK/SrfK